MENRYYGQNLNILKRFIGIESVDLVYLDPSSIENRNYEVVSKDESRLEADPRSSPVGRSKFFLTFVKRDLC